MQAAMHSTNPFTAQPDAGSLSASGALETGEARTFVTFELAGQWLAVDVVHVREILDRQVVTPLPKAPPDVDGVIDVRGVAVAVVDLSRKLGLMAGPESADTRFLVFEFAVGEGNSKALAVRADRVLEVSQIPDGAIERPSEHSEEWNRELLSGVTRNNDHLVMLINLETVFPSGVSTQNDDIFKFG